MKRKRERKLKDGVGSDRLDDQVHQNSGIKVTLEAIWRLDLVVQACRPDSQGAGTVRL